MDGNILTYLQVDFDISKVAWERFIWRESRMELPVIEGDKNFRTIRRKFGSERVNPISGSDRIPQDHTVTLVTSLSRVS